MEDPPAQMPSRQNTGSPSIPDLYVGFFIAGMATTLLGPVLPALSQRWQVTDTLIGLAFTVQFLGSVSMSALSSTLVLRCGGSQVMLAGFVLLAAGIGALTVASWLPGMAAILCYGCGLGLVLPTTNVLVAAASPGREASAVSLVNVSWGGGAVAWPIVVASLGRGERVAWPLAVLATLVAGMALRFLLTLTGPRRAARVAAAPMPSPDADAGRPGNGNAADARPALPAPPATTILVAIFASLLFFYAGGESAIGGWIAEHVRRMEAGQTQHWTIAPMVFWAALAAGRLLTPLLLRAVDESHVLVAALVMLLATSTVLALASSVPVALLAAAVAGFCLAPVFPITFADLSRTLGPLRPRAVGPAYAMANVGSAVLPWLVGLCSTRFGTLRAGFVVPIASAAAMLALTAIRIARRRRHGTARQDGEDITHTPQ
jgi:FHS family glucose/mannose:H+ symporter-like MFS transporter